MKHYVDTRFGFEHSKHRDAFVQLISPLASSEKEVRSNVLEAATVLGYRWSVREAFDETLDEWVKRPQDGEYEEIVKHMLYDYIRAGYHPEEFKLYALDVVDTALWEVREQLKIDELKSED